MLARNRIRLREMLANLSMRDRHVWRLGWCRRYIGRFHFEDYGVDRWFDCWFCYSPRIREPFMFCARPLRRGRYAVRVAVRRGFAAVELLRQKPATKTWGRCPPRKSPRVLGERRTYDELRVARRASRQGADK